MSTEPVRTQIVVVTGMSGAGRSTALRALEDAGFFCVDNLPTPLTSSAALTCEQGGIARIALGVDVRVRSFLEGAERALDGLSESGRDVRILFLDASNEALLRRYSSTRRPHPLSAPDAAGARQVTAVLEGIELERRRLSALRGRAGAVLDTTRLSVHELRRRILDDFGPGEGKASRLRPRLMSFGFKYGAPADADLTFDVRFIENPYFIDELRPLSGLDSPVARYVMAREGTLGFLERVVSLLSFALPRYEAEGKSYLTVGIGCTGGRHRSVALAEAMGARLRDETDFEIDVSHRDLREAEKELAAEEAVESRSSP